MSLDGRSLPAAAGRPLLGRAGARAAWWPVAAAALAIGLAGGSAGAAAPLEFAASGRAAHAMLTRLCDDFGGRLTGTDANRQALERLAAELRDLGFDPEIVPFTMPGWSRGEDRVEMTAPRLRTLRAVALAYTERHEPFEAGVVALATGRADEYPSAARGKVGLLGASSALPMREIAGVAAAHGLRGLLLTNREGGGQLLPRTGSFLGEPLPVPVYSITREDGLWMERLLGRGTAVRVRMETRSHSREVQTANVALRLRGRSPERIVVAAHIDSWDLGQGAIDNGLGIAQLFALAHALRGHELGRTLDLVWCNGEEQGLWGSRHAAAALGSAPVVAMINLDMVGVPLAVNALGDASLVPVLERWNAARASPLPRGVQNFNWFGSDHTPFQLAGVRAITFSAPLPREASRYYHDFADTIDKLPEQLVADSAAVAGDLVAFLADEPGLSPLRRPRGETERLFTTFGLDRRMRAIGWWPFP